MDIYYLETSENWHKNISTSKRYEMGWCDRDFFGEDVESDHLWEAWENTLIMCPKIRKGEEP